MIDASSIQYAQKMIHQGYGFQNACRIAGVSEPDLRLAIGAPRKRASPSPWITPQRPYRETPRAQPPVTLSGPSLQITREVAEKYQMTVADMTSGKRSRHYAYARHEVMYRIKTERRLSLPDIGRRLGGRDHTTVLHGVRSHAERLAWIDVLMVFAAFNQCQLDLFARAA